MATIEQREYNTFVTSVSGFLELIVKFYPVIGVHALQ